MLEDSLNGLSPDAETNDRVRGYKGHHDHVMRVVDSCKRHGIDVMLPITTSKELLPETFKLLEFAKQHGMTASMGLLAPTGRQEGRKEQLFDESLYVLYPEALFSTDAIHLTPAGSLTVARRVVDVLEPYVEAARADAAR